MGKQLITLDAFVPDRDFITIRLLMRYPWWMFWQWRWGRRRRPAESKNFELRTKDELSLTDLAQIRDLSVKLQPKIGQDPTEETVFELQDYADRLIKMIVVGMDDSTLRSLKLRQRFQIVQVFTRLAGAMPTPASPQESQPTTADSSPGSGDSMEAPSPTG